MTFELGNLHRPALAGDWPLLECGRFQDSARSDRETKTTHHGQPTLRDFPATHGVHMNPQGASPGLRLIRFTAPFRFAVRRYFSAVSGHVVAVAALGVSEAVCNAVGLLMLMPLISALTGSADISVGRAFPIPTDTLTLLGLFALAVTLLAASMHLRLKTQSRALDLLRCSAEEAAIQGLLRLGDLSAAPGSDAKAHPLVPRLLGNVSYACGFAMRQFALSLVDILQLLVFVVALALLNPLLAAIFLLTAPIGLLIYSRSVARVTALTDRRRQINADARTEIKTIRSLFQAGPINPQELRRILDDYLGQGALGESMRQKLGQRHEIRRGPLFIEAIFPVVLVVMVLLSFANGEWTQSAAAIIIALMLLRALTGVTQRLGGLFIATGRHFSDLSWHMRLHTSGDLMSLHDAPSVQDVDD